MVTSLNFFGTGAWAGAPEGPDDQPGASAGHLSSTQRHSVQHLWEAAVDFLSRESPLPSITAIKHDLFTRQTDYAGEAVAVRRELVAEKVFPAWPERGEAASVPVVSFLDGELLDDVRDPRSCLLPPEQWPEEPPRSRVWASDTEWYKIVKEGAARGIFAEVPDELVFRDSAGRPVVNGAMGIDKHPKGPVPGPTLLRFISIFTPINSYMRKLRGDDHTLPTATMLNACILEDGEELWDDAEDQKGCFNIFRLPDEWLGYCAYSKQVSAAAFGDDPNRMAWVGIRSVAMGSKIAVSIMQRVIRTLVFDIVGADPRAELRRDRAFPDGDVSIVCLDGFDFVRKAQSRLCKLQIVESMEHQHFVAACAKHGIPLNPAKSLVAQLRAGILGGLLLGDKGWLKLAPEKANALVVKTAVLATEQQWQAGALQHWAGQACFAAGFRRPLFAVLEQIFPAIQTALDAPAPADAAVIDEMIAFACLLPLAYTNLRAPVKRTISCTDASEDGGGAVCPAQCGAVTCCVDCLLQHRRQGCSLAGSQVLSESGQKHVRLEADDEFTAWEHWTVPGGSYAGARRLAHAAGPRHRHAAGLGGRSVVDADAHGQLAVQRLLWRVLHWGFAVVQHPWDSPLWQSEGVQSLLRYKGVLCTRVTVTGVAPAAGDTDLCLLHNCRLLEQTFSAEETVAQRGASACTQEQFCAAYSRAVARALRELGQQGVPAAPSDQPARVETQLARARRGGTQGALAPAAQEIGRLLQRMVPGGEQAHLRSMLSWADTKGAHVWMSTSEVADLRQTVPYPAFAWKWHVVMSYRWKAKQHINVLELIAYLNYVRKKSRSRCYHSLRFINVFDSQVAAAVVAKGRSSSRRLNRPRRKLMALELAMDAYSFGVWTISEWQFADAASRLHAGDGEG
ncbi:unnamed protein product [Prorocentrum cordatum]|uniref:RNA-dependent RNA polymerase n=1 Tax=Prorocentrum cordatum TaxID=2364126 RepID=A0ABN9XZZ6_9DINO|nr:unnamed protein product [Polarella glacialis]